MSKIKDKAVIEKLLMVHKNAKNMHCIPSFMRFAAVVAWV